MAKKPKVAEKRKRRLAGGYPLSTKKTPKSPPKTTSPMGTSAAQHLADAEVKKVELKSQALRKRVKRSKAAKKKLKSN